jgi:hypothetical protein
MQNTSSGSGGISSDPPAHVAPSLRAKVWAATSPGRVKVGVEDVDNLGEI